MGGIADPKRLHRLRRQAAEEQARERVTSQLGAPGTPEERERFEREVRRLVDEWTRGWEGSGLAAGALPPRWLPRLRRRRPPPG